LPNPKAVIAALAWRGHQILRRFHDRIVAATHKLRFGVFPHPQSQIALPPDWNTIILCHKVGIGPVGVRPFLQSELPP
jgi:hypothetical protein